MKGFNTALIFLILITFSACSAKDVKKVGSNASNAGALGLIVGGAIYGVGSLMEDDEEENKKEEKLKK